MTRFLRDIAVALALAAVYVVVAWGPAPAHAATRPSWHTCTRFATRLTGGMVVDNDHFAGAPGPSCLTVTGHRVTIGTSYQPAGGVVAYDAIRFGRYPWSDDPGFGLPAPVTRVATTLHVTASGGPGRYLYDADVWFSRTAATGPLNHVREMIIATRWQGYSPYCAPRVVKVGRRRWLAGACMTGPAGHRHLLIRFLAVRQSRRSYIDLAAFLTIARRRGWLRKTMTADSVSWAPEVWSGGRGLTYSMSAAGLPRFQAPKATS